MYLKQLEIQGFKSFAQATVLTFQPGITVVVGPNGSGKSNIVDAVRWVLGEQSKTLLRGKKAEDVIFVGSAAKARAQMASVTLIFDNQDGKLPIDSAEVVFTRRLDRDGNSEYLINGQPGRLMDITEALMSAGFIQSRYTVIGQGTIDQFLLQGPGEIKTLIEEGAGLGALYAKREKTLRRLETTRTNLEQVRALIAEIEPRLRSLRRQAKKVEARSQIESEWKELFSGRMSFILNNLEADKSKLDAEAEKLQQSLSVLDEELKKYYDQLDSGGSGSVNIGAELTGLQEKLAAEQQIKEKLQISLAELKSKPSGNGQTVNASALKSKIDELENEEKELKQQWQELKRNIDEAEGDIEEIVKILNQAKADLVPRFNAIADRFLAGQRQFANKLASQLKDVTNNLVRRREELIKATIPPGLKPEDKKNLESELAQSQENIKQLEQAIKDKLAEVTKFTSERSRFDKEIRKKEHERSVVSGQLSDKRIARARIEARLEEEERRAQAEFGASFKQTVQSAKPLADASQDERIVYLKKQLEIIGGLDELTMQEYEETEDRHAYLTSQVNDLDKADADLTQILQELDGVIKQKFDQSFEQTNEKFGQYFRLLFNGGKAQLVKMKEQKLKVKSEEADEQSPDVHEEVAEEFGDGSAEIVGIEVRATPPGKKLSSIASLSGGERTLTSIALLMALLESNPSPFVVLDEVDAALDESNSIRFAKILEHLSDKTQFITITHNRETMRRAHTLYGVTMGDNGMSQVLSIKFDQSLAYAKE